MSRKLLSTVLCNNVLVQKRGERVTFQILLPRDVVRITGIETGVRSRYCRPVVAYRREDTAGLLTLQASGTLGYCYSSYVKVDQNYQLQQDLGFSSYIAGFRYGDNLLANTVAMGAHREPDTLDIVAPRVLLGTYTDQWGDSMWRNMAYRLSIYLWVTINDEYNETSAPCTEQ
ncbi:hypothetical protein HGH93_12010 [Chitinophaga polysaccharea]|uniref:hypothetical protein n=1 Tax=Chitinophaga polysaccharea TaxID=1293035 RepID=UPI0014558146|nr:hypothetical protein [Chitinophaga polysaccharea]NLR58831.1 hypothetical protein [Chitinophaga polysaccharea]